MERNKERSIRHYDRIWIGMQPVKPGKYYLIEKTERGFILSSTCSNVLTITPEPVYVEHDALIPQSKEPLARNLPWILTWDIHAVNPFHCCLN